MNDSMTSAMDQDHLQRSGTLPTIALAMSASGLGACVSLMFLIWMGFISVPWDAVFLPWVTCAGLLPFCILALVVSCVSRARYRDGRSTVSIIVGVFAVVAALAASGLVMLAAIANHPI